MGELTAWLPVVITNTALRCVHNFIAGGSNFMGRTMRSAKAAGAKFERDVADYLAARVDDRIDRRVKTGAKDRGDIGGVRLHGQRVVIECKNVATMSLPQWTREAQIEAGNDDALVGVVVHKRHGTGDVGQQWVSMTLDDLVAILTGEKVTH